MSPTEVSREEFDMFKDNIVREHGEIKSSLKAMWYKIDGRPSWAVLLIITFLSSATVGLLVDILLRK